MSLLLRLNECLQCLLSLITTTRAPLKATGEKEKERRKEGESTLLAAAAVQEQQFMLSSFCLYHTQTHTQVMVMW